MCRCCACVDNEAGSMNTNTAFSRLHTSGQASRCERCEYVDCIPMYAKLLDCTSYPAARLNRLELPHCVGR